MRPFTARPLAMVVEGRDSESDSDYEPSNSSGSESEEPADEKALDLEGGTRDEV